mmetsp:Transcript_25138/g.51340  ORF Transcript_25138/g.51340 Transcript_25138/m.51340 type:complete len:116 (-) Transcript_25138:1211-1558(-)
MLHNITNAENDAAAALSSIPFTSTIAPSPKTSLNNEDKASGINASPIALTHPAIIAVVRAPLLSVRKPPKGAPINPESPAAESKAPAPMAPPGNVSAARIGIVAILAANPKLTPH